MDELVKQAINGDKEAFCRLYGAYKDKMYRYAYYKLGNQNDAEDAVQDAVLSAYQQIHKLIKANAFSTWMFRILTASCNAIIKQQIDSRNINNIDEMSNIIVTNLDQTVEKTELQEALDILNDDEREIVLLSAVAGFKSNEIANMLDMASGSVRSKLSRSLNKMRKFLEG